MQPITLAVLNDCQLVVDGVAAMLAPYGDRVRVLELGCRTRVVTPVDVALYDAFAVETSAVALRPHLDNPLIGALAVYTWVLDPDTVGTMLSLGVRGVLAKSLDAPALLTALEAVHAGEVCVSPAPADPEHTDIVLNPLDGHGLTAREAEIVAMIATGLTNVEIAERLYLSVNTIKGYIRSAYRKMDVQRRPQAVTWAFERGLHATTLRRVLDAR